MIVISKKVQRQSINGLGFFRRFLGGDKTPQDHCSKEYTPRTHLGDRRKN